MKTKPTFRTLLILSLLPVIATGCSIQTPDGSQSSSGGTCQICPQGQTGEQGVPGPAGPKGEPGSDGVSVISIEKTGTNGLIDTYTITFSNGTTSTFTVTNGENGAQGIQGNPGQDGHSPVVTIGENGNWYVDGKDTNTPAQGGKGNDGLTPFIGQNENWWIGDTDTGVKASGSAGENGNSITGIELVCSEDGVTTYRITFSDNTYFDYVVKDGQKGEEGNKGKDGTSMMTGNGEPASEAGNVGDSFINLENWDFYVRAEEGWKYAGNIKGQTGNDGHEGISIESTTIDDNGDLIVVLSNGNSINAGHVKDMELHTVNFYCGDLLVDTQTVRHGEKIKMPELDDFLVKHWYIDKEFEYEWLWYGLVVTEDMALYGDYEGISKTISFGKEDAISVDEYGFGTISSSGKEICVSKALETNEYLTALEERGILFNKAEIGLIESLSITIEAEGSTSAKLYFGNTPFAFDSSIDLTSGENTIEMHGAEYFTIQNEGNQAINIGSLQINYSRKAKIVDESLPTVIVNTKDSKEISSRVEYVECTVSTQGATKDFEGLKAQIKIRGNSTSRAPKKPYRIKLDKKNPLFGYAKAKNWSLLAEYMDGSNMHNYTALKFAKMVRGEETFAPDPLHVNLTLNGENVGIYTFCEHIDAKDGRLEIEQDNIWDKSFDEINFYIERDGSTAKDSTEIEGETYFFVEMENYALKEYCFALKYPQKEDFEEKLADGSMDPHEEEFQTFFNSLKEYVTDICNRFISYSHDENEFENVAMKVDMESLALYAVIDQAFSEIDHNSKSFKMYRKDGGLLQFGPNWDYDSCAYSLPYKGTYVLDPFAVGGSYTRTSFGEKWGSMLFNDVTNGRPLFKAIWDNITLDGLNSFIDAQLAEMKAISQSSTYDCGRWMNNQYFALFDNQLYYARFITNQLPYLKGFYS